MKLLKLLNSVIIAVQVGHLYYRGDEHATQLAVARTYNVEKIVIVVATGRESWGLYNTMRQFYTDFHKP